MRHAAKYFRIAGILTGLAVSGCALDGPALEQEFTESSQVNFSVKGNVEHRFDPMSWQTAFRPSPCTFTVCNDSMSDYYTLRCDRVPAEVGETLKCDAEWTTYSDIKKKKGLEFKVVKADPAVGAVWLWCQSAMIGAAVFIVPE